MKNMESIGEHKSVKESRININWALEKLNFIRDYKFTIAFENEFRKGWTTEKLTHPLLINSIPIYFGNKLVGRDFNTKCFINRADFKSTEELIEHVKKVDQDDKLYKKYLEEPFFNNSEQYEFNHEKRILKRLDEIIKSRK